MNKTIKITFITPCFCRGADCSDNGEPEIRPASIRGELHWWFRILGGTPQEENAVFGNVNGGGMASKIVIRVKYPDLGVQSMATLPHKKGKQDKQDNQDKMAASKKAFKPGSAFELLISTRLGGLSVDLEKKFERALEAWLHLGALGLRSTRGGGNFSWEGQPQTPEEYRQAIALFNLKTVLIDEVFERAEDARTVISDTLDYKAFDDNNAPLGKINGRKTSPLRFRIIKFSDSDYRIAAIWDGRTEVTGNTAGDLKNAVQILKESKKQIGILLDQANW